MNSHLQRMSGTRARVAIGLVSSLILIAASGWSRAGAPVVYGSSSPKSSACDVSKPASSTTINVLAYSSPSIDPFTNAMVACSHLSNLTVNHSPVDFSAQLTKGQLSLSQGTASYDIIEVYNNTLNQYAISGWLVPLDRFWAKYKARYNLSDIDPLFVRGFRYKGRLYGLPMEINVHEVIYRKDILQSLHLQPPKTFNGLVADCKKIQQSHKVRQCLGVPFSASLYISSAFNNALASLGGRWVNPKTHQPELNTPKARAAAQALRSILPYMGSDAMASDEASITAQLETGATAMAIMYSGSVGDLLDPSKTRYANQFAFAPAPSVAGGKPYATLFIDGFALAKNSKVNRDLLFQVAAVGTGAAAARSAGVLADPARDSVLHNRALAARAPYWQAAKQTVNAGAKSPPPLPFLVGLQAAARPFIAAAVTGKTPVDKAMAQAQAAAIAYLKHGGYLP